MEFSTRPRPDRDRGLRDRVRRLEALHELGLQLVDQRDPARVAARSLDLVRTLVRADASSLWFVLPDDGRLELVVKSPPEHDPGHPVGMTMAPGEGLCGRVVTGGRALATAAYSRFDGASQDFLPVVRGPVLGVPLGREPRVAGVLSLSRREGEPAFDLDDVATVERFAAVLTTVLANARLYRDLEATREESDRRARQLEALHAAAGDIIGPLDPADAPRLVTERAARLLGATGGLYLVRDDGHLDLALSLTSLPSSRLAPGEGLAGHVAQLGHGIVLEDYRAWPGRLRQFDDRQYRSALAVPLSRDGRVVGVIWLVDPHVPGRFGPRELETLELFAPLAAAALENARLHAAERRRLRDQQLRARVADAVGRLRGVRELCEAVVGELALALGEPHVSIYALREHRLVMGAQVGYERPFLEIPLDQGVNGRVARTGRPAFVARAASDPDFVPAVPALQSHICVPVMVGGLVLGTLSVEGALENAFDSGDLELLLSVAGPVGVALENALLHEQAQARALELERLRAEAEAAAVTDALTSLPNRRAFDQALAGALAARSGRRRLALAIIDLSGFKAVNDRHGHAAGDEALRQVARCLESGPARAYRVGGDEFALLLEDLGAPDALEEVSRLAGAVAALEFGGGLRVTPNVGLAQRPEDGSDAETLLSLADDRMYAAKRAGHAILPSGPAR